jgi:hypothetical protein
MQMRDGAIEPRSRHCGCWGGGGEASSRRCGCAPAVRRNGACTGYFTIAQLPFFTVSSTRPRWSSPK